ncbi:MAG: ABC transporter substrate-binding protein [Ilumatobacteraceae bacterium]
MTGGVSLAALLAACGGDDSAGEVPAGTAAPGRTVQHMYGTTGIEGTPSRILTVGLTDQDAVFALGFAPIASQAWYADQVVYPWAESYSQASGVATKIILPGELNTETVAAEDPDLIIAISAGIDQGQYELLSQIAPTIAGSADYDAWTTPWQVQTVMIGQALGREAQAQALVAAAEQKFAEAAARHPEWQGATAVLASQYIEGQLLVYASSDPATKFLTDLGFTIATAIDEHMNDTFGVPTLSAELFELIDVDLVLWDGYREALEDAGLFDVPTFAALDIVREGRNVFPSASVADALSFRNVLSLPWALEQLEPQLVAAFDGDPATSAEA